MKDIYQIVKDEIHANMNRSITVNSVADDVLSVCSVKWARIGLYITDSDDVQFTITDVDYSANTITVDAVGFVGNGTLEAWKFFIGTPLATNEEWKAASLDERTKVPFIWMVEPTPERIMPEDSSLERESEVRLVFLESYNNNGSWLTVDTHEIKTQAIYNAITEFRKAMESNLLFAPVTTDINVRNFTRFGSETERGFEQNIIDADLTGVEVRITLPIYKNDACNC